METREHTCPLCGAPTGTTTPGEILAAVCRAAEINRLDLLSPRHDRHLSDARAAAAYLMKRHLQMSLKGIARVMNRESHSSAINWLKNHREQPMVQTIARLAAQHLHAQYDA